jgi:hypothetical protein
MVGGSLGTPASSTTKTGRHDIAEILLKVVLNTINQIKPTYLYFLYSTLYERSDQEVITNQGYVFTQ